MMKEIMLCYLLVFTVVLGVTLTAAHGSYGTKGNSFPELLDALLHGRVINIQDNDSDKPTTEAIPSNEDDDDSIAEIQGVFNVLAQADMERAKLAGRINSHHALVQFWTGLVKSLWNKGKSYLKKNLCCQEQDLKALLQELTNEEMGANDEANSNDDNEVRAQLQVLFNALQKMEANVMIEGKKKSLGNTINDKIKSITKEFLC